MTDENKMFELDQWLSNIRDIAGAPSFALIKFEVDGTIKLIALATNCKSINLIQNAKQTYENLPTYVG